MIEKLKIFKNKLFILMIVSFAVTYLGGQDAITSTILYNKLDLTNPIKFQIEDKYNKKENGQSFPDLNFRGKIVGTDDEKEIKVSKGDFDKHEIGQIIKVYKTKSDEFMTEHEIDNQGIIHIGKTGFSFVFIPTIIFFTLGLFCLIVILKK
ncbi:hypothetical protein [Prolixibacter denitrificans]|uniref:Uncharacterized protein n=1 Tax=Prolixibacter denitrificans TaxID=1541063 RepID=A0A2P8CFK1_9BACT|nr:hypothetical protein [Prolixibacter denitrificans]PSK83748.1 hypothetical protein CLV93_103163 [Prolixibacter denitrificans]GET23292.1 hypothetical protein JCM18694_35380 [Prolixibacter denitrificans]